MRDRQLFGSFKDDGSPVVAFLSQQLVLPIASLIIIMIVTPEIPWKYVQAGTKGQLIQVALNIAVSAIVGIVLGTLVLRTIPTMRAMGKWIGLIPSILITGALVSDAHTFTLTTALAEFFFPGPDGEGWWAFWFFTCPTISTVCY